MVILSLGINPQINCVIIRPSPPYIQDLKTLFLVWGFENFEPHSVEMRKEAGVQKYFHDLGYVEWKGHAHNNFLELFCELWLFRLYFYWPLASFLAKRNSFFKSARASSLCPFFNLFDRIRTFSVYNY